MEGKKRRRRGNSIWRVGKNIGLKGEETAERKCRNGKNKEKKIET